VTTEPKCLALASSRELRCNLPRGHAGAHAHTSRRHGVLHAWPRNAGDTMPVSGGSIEEILEQLRNLIDYARWYAFAGVAAALEETERAIHRSLASIDKHDGVRNAPRPLEPVSKGREGSPVVNRGSRQDEPS
jgi:hypothetical protein